MYYLTIIIQLLTFPLYVYIFTFTEYNFLTTRFVIDYCDPK